MKPRAWSKPIIYARLAQVELGRLCSLSWQEKVQRAWFGLSQPYKSLDKFALVIFHRIISHTSFTIYLDSTIFRPNSHFLSEVSLSRSCTRPSLCPYATSALPLSRSAFAAASVVCWLYLAAHNVRSVWLAITSADPERRGQLPFCQVWREL